MGQERLAVELDLARRGGESGRHAVLLFGVLAVARLERDTHSARVLAKRVERYPGGTELVTLGRLDVTMPEAVGETETTGEIEHDLGIPARLAAWLDHALPQLHERLRLRADVEADLEAL